MSYQKDNLDDFVANAAQPIDLTFKKISYVQRKIYTVPIVVRGRR